MNCSLFALLLLFITLLSQMMSGYSWIFPARLLVNRIVQGKRQTRLFGSTGPVQRIERILANRGVGTRTEVANILKQGRVKVKGKVIRSAAERFPTNTEIYLDNKLIEEIPEMVVYHKPVGIQSTYGDPWQRLNLNSIRERFSYFKSLHPIGRLDADSSGLLLFGRDGAITQHLLNPKKKIEREYDVLVLGAVDFQRLKETLSKGINTSEGVFPAALFSSQTFSSVQDLKYFNDLIDARNTTLAANGGKNADHVDEVELQTIRSAKAVSYLRVAVTEGKYRMVRRILHNSGHSVCFLRRRRYGNILLHPDDVVNPSNASEQRLEDVWPIPSLLTEDEVRKVTEEEWRWIQSLTR